MTAAEGAVIAAACEYVDWLTRVANGERSSVADIRRRMEIAVEDLRRTQPLDPAVLREPWRWDEADPRFDQ